jgi:Holliday junction resolvase RusA-like endonuclease
MCPHGVPPHHCADCGDDTVTFTVPGIPQGKGRARAAIIRGFARIYTPEKTRSYEGTIAWCGAAAMAGRPPFLVPMALALLIRCQIPASWSKKKRVEALNGDLVPATKPDVDNILKAVGDGLNGVVWADDVQIVRVNIEKGYAETPGIVVTAAPAMLGRPPQPELLLA